MASLMRVVLILLVLSACVAQPSQPVPEDIPDASIVAASSSSSVAGASSSAAGSTSHGSSSSAASSASGNASGIVGSSSSSGAASTAANATSSSTAAAASSSVSAGAAAASSSSGSSSGDPRASAPRGGLFTTLVEEVVIEVDHEAGAAPYTGPSGILGGDTWDLFRTNLEAMFQTHPRTLTVDTTPEQMENIGNLDDDQFTVVEMLDLAALHRDEVQTDTRRTFYMLFVDGYYEQNDTARTDILGVSLFDSGVMVFFKPVIESSADPRSVEQVVLVHEMGHAAGLVDIGTPATSVHEDTGHLGHCANPDCAMYWAVDSQAGVLDFLTGRVLGSTSVLLDDACLADLEAAAEP